MHWCAPTHSIIYYLTNYSNAILYSQFSHLFEYKINRHLLSPSDFAPKKWSLCRTRLNFHGIISKFTYILLKYRNKINSWCGKDEERAACIQKKKRKIWIDILKWKWTFKWSYINAILMWQKEVPIHRNIYTMQIISYYILNIRSFVVNDVENIWTRRWTSHTTYPI